MTRETDSTHRAPTIEKQNEKHLTHCCGCQGLWGKSVAFYWTLKFTSDSEGRNEDSHPVWSHFFNYLEEVFHHHLLNQILTTASWGEPSVKTAALSATSNSMTDFLKLHSSLPPSSWTTPLPTARRPLARLLEATAVAPQLSKPAYPWAMRSAALLQLPGRAAVRALHPAARGLTYRRRLWRRARVKLLPKAEC